MDSSLPGCVYPYNYILSNCLISGLQLKSLLKGGSQAWITLIYLSVIMGYEDVEQQLSFPATPLSLVAPLNTALRPFQDGDVPLSFRHLITRFLKGSGIPCPRKFETARAHFNNVVALGLDKINLPGFRPHLLVWAVTGIPSIDLTSSDRIKVSIFSKLHVFCNIADSCVSWSFARMTTANMQCPHLSARR